MNWLSEIWSAICDGAKELWNSCKRIIKATISFLHDIIDGLFDILEDLLGGDVPSDVEDSPIKPFLGDINKLIENAPVKKVGLFDQRKNNYIKGFYDTRTGKIEKPTYVAGDKVDDELLETMDDKPLIILG
jgi:hypothetical protein